MGRDRFIEVMMSAGFRLKKGSNYRRTTYSTVRSYSNLIKGMKVSAPSTIWQSDITYLDVEGKFYYAVFIIDVYTKKIVGYSASKNMRAETNIKALRMALMDHAPPQIHHSDRGSQYGCHRYTGLLKSYNTKISMGLKAQDNAYAERINRTIKEEYLSRWCPQTFEQLTRCLAKAVGHYNHKRPHNHLARNTPACFENKCLKAPNFNKPVIIIFDDNNL